MTTYTINPEYIDQFGADATTETVLTIDDICMIARGWETDIMSVISMCIVNQDNPADEEDLLSEYSMDTIVNYMDDSIREFVHNEISPCGDAEFVREYLTYADIVIN